MGYVQTFRELAADPGIPAIVIVLAGCLLSAPIFGFVLSAIEALRFQDRRRRPVGPLMRCGLHALLLATSLLPSIQVQNEELLFPYLLVKWALLLLPVVLIAWSFACLLRQPVEASASDSTRGDDSG